MDYAQKSVLSDNCKTTICYYNNTVGRENMKQGVTERVVEQSNIVISNSNLFAPLVTIAIAKALSFFRTVLRCVSIECVYSTRYERQ